MKLLGQLTENIFCAFCKIQRRVYVKKHIGIVNVLLSAFASTSVMFAIWGEYDSRVFMILSVFICMAEIFILLRWRLSVKCPYCSFDPVLYYKDRKQLVENIKETLERRRQSPEFLLSSKNPLLNLSKRQLSDRLSDATSGSQPLFDKQPREDNVHGSERSSNYSNL